MKKLLIFVVFLAVLFSNFSCKSKNEDNEYTKRLFELRTVLYEGESENYEVEVFSGMREENYAFDGVANKLIPFFLIKLTPKNEFEGNIKISFTTDKKYTVLVERNPNSNEFSYDFGKKVDSLNKFLVSIDNGITNEEVTALNMTIGLTEDYNAAMARAIAKYKLDVGEETAAQDLDSGFEVAMRIVRKKSNSEKLFWHFMICKPDGKVYGTLIEAV